MNIEQGTQNFEPLLFRTSSRLFCTFNKIENDAYALSPYRAPHLQRHSRRKPAHFIPKTYRDQSAAILMK
jgi:hypothetical protein